MSKQETLLTKADGIATITLNRPSAYNAITLELQESLLERLHECKNDDAIKVIILTGAGKGFCSGADASLIATQPNPLDVRDNLKYGYGYIIRLMREMHKPIICAINGSIAGAGISFGMACDYRIMAAETSMCFAFINIGLVSDAGATWFLAREVGYTKALELLVDGELIPADECHRLGLVNSLVPTDEVMDAAVALAEKLKKRPLLAFYATKKSVNYALEHGLYDTIGFEAEQQMQLIGTEDHKESVLAFLQKRKPIFKGK